AGIAGTRRRSGCDQAARTGRAERLDLTRAAVPAVALRVVEPDRHLERAVGRRPELHALPDGAQTDAPVLPHLDRHVGEPLGARDVVLLVPELERVVHAHELVRRHLGAEDVRAALRSDLEEDVVLPWVHLVEAGLGEDGAELQPGDGTAR